MDRLQNKPLVYVASPFAGDTEYNTVMARKYCRFAVTQGCIPIAPHLLYPQILEEDNPDEREMGISFALTLLELCDVLWVFGGTVSKGMAREIEKADKLGIPTRRFTSECQEVS